MGERHGVPSMGEGPDHRDTTAPLRPYQDPGLPSPFDLLTVVAEYREDHLDERHGP
jgi:hypothetical protein